MPTKLAKGGDHYGEKEDTLCDSTFHCSHDWLSIDSRRMFEAYPARDE